MTPRTPLRAKIIKLLPILFGILLFFASGCATGQGGDKNSNSEATLVKARHQAQPGAHSLEKYLGKVTGHRVGILCNAASLVYDTHLVDTLYNLDIDIRYIFAPEHGFRGEADAGAKVEDSVDPKTGIPIVSLYGRRSAFPAEYLDSLDLLIFDLQDVGVRFFTYINDLYYAMQASARADIPMIVLDRPNPNGYFVDGPMLREEFKSGVGLIPVPVVYGLTIGELAGMINGEGWLGENLKTSIEVIPCLDYTHKDTYSPPVRPSPNLPNLRSILLYPSLCFFEGTTCSIGRGTYSQFQIIGHPALEGMPYSFTPVSLPGATNPKQMDLVCHGLSLEEIPIDSVMAWKQLNFSYLFQFYSGMSQKGEEFFLSNNFIDLLAGTDALRLAMKEGRTEAEIRVQWQPELSAFKLKRKQYLLYPDFEE